MDNNDNNNDNNLVLNIALIILIIFLAWLFFNNKEKFGNVNNSESEENINHVIPAASVPAKTTPPTNSSEKYSSELLGLHNASMDEYMKDYYPTYAHQLECPKSCGLSPDNTCVQNADPIKMSLEAMTSANNKSCSTCTQNLTSSQYSNLPADTIKQDQERLDAKKVSFDNVNSYVDFSNVTFQDSLAGPTQVDKLAVERTSIDGTCNLDKYGTRISQVYDGLIGTSYKQKEKITQPLTGFYNGNAEGNIYAQPITNVTN